MEPAVPETKNEATLAEDEAQLERYSVELVAAIEAVIPRWVQRLLTERAVRGGVQITHHRAESASIAQATAQLVMPELRRLFAADVDHGVGNPLAALRLGIAPMTDALHKWGAASPPRDDFQVSHFPDDHYDLGPASFGDVDQSLHHPGLVWGAARAHVHLRRRREDQT